MITSLEIYNSCGFKFFLCSADKSPNTPGFWPIDEERKKYNKKTDKEELNRDWRQPENQISAQKAETLMKTGRMIGAHIPDDFIVIDLDRHAGKSDGLEFFVDLKKKLNIDIDFIKDTTVIQTGGGGYHLIFYVGKSHGISQGSISENGKEVGIDIKTSSGYVVTAGSPGYSFLNPKDTPEPAELTTVLRDWLIERKPKEKPRTSTQSNSGDLLEPKKLKAILNKIPITKFQSNERWQKFITSAIAAAGCSQEVYDILENWSLSDPKYSTESNGIRNRIESFSEKGGISVGTFIMFLKEENLSKHLINQVISIEPIAATLLDSEEKESELPIKDPDYNDLASTVVAQEFFKTSGNSAAKTLLFYAFDGNVIYVKSEKESYFFNGSRWEVLKDYYSIVFTVLLRIAHIIYSSAPNSKESSDLMKKVIKSINDTTWKTKTITELNAMTREDKVAWDSPAIKETITTKDGVIDFSSGKMDIRKGIKKEFRRDFIPFTTKQILTSEKPTHFIQFLKDIFPSEDTFKMAKQLIALSISGNSSKRIFQLWHGEGSNGKSLLIDILKKVMGNKAVTYPAALLMIDKYGKGLSVTPELASFQGKYLAVATEVDQGSEFSMGTIKNIAGDDTITANPKFKDQIEFDATWQLILAVNDLPKFNSLDSAFIGRLHILPFVMSYPKNEKQKSEYLSKGIPAERIGKTVSKKILTGNILKQKAGIVKFLIKEYLELETELAGEIQESDEASEKKSHYTRDNDDFGKFIEDVCRINSNGFVSSEEITEAFKDYMGIKKAASKWVVMNIKKHSRMITSGSKEVDINKNSPFKNTEIRRRRGLIGISLKPQIPLTLEAEEQSETEKAGPYWVEKETPGPAVVPVPDEIPF